MSNPAFLASATRPATHLAFAILTTLTLPATAEAAATRFVASSGNDGNVCSRAAPCRTLQRAHNVTAAGGAVFVLDTGSFGDSLTITKSITFAADGVAATLVHPGGITINGAGITVTLRGLLLNAGTGSVIGINIVDAAAVHIEDCAIERFGNGIQMINTSAELFVSDSVSRDNSNDGLFASGNGQVTIYNSRFENNGGDGIQVNWPARVTVARSVMSGNGGDGLELRGNGRADVSWTTAARNEGSGYLVAAGAELNLEYSVAHANGIGLFVEDDSLARISNNAITGPGGGIRNFGVVRTRENNSMEGGILGDGSVSGFTPF